jgi:hypothetical protein
MLFLGSPHPTTTTSTVPFASGRFPLFLPFPITNIPENKIIDKIPTKITVKQAMATYILCWRAAASAANFLANSSASRCFFLLFPNSASTPAGRKKLMQHTIQIIDHTIAL